MSESSQELDAQDLPPSELLEVAKAKSRKLTPRERRTVIKFVDDAGVKDANGKPVEYTNYELAALLNVDEKTIRIDKRKILKEYTSIITPEDALTFVGEFIKGHDDLMRRAFAGLRQSPDGTLAHQNYLKIISDLHKRRVAMLQEIGAIPKELGNLNVNQELWEAYVLDDKKGNATSGVKRVAIPTSVLSDGDDEEPPVDGEVFEATIEGDQQ